MQKKAHDEPPLHYLARSDLQCCWTCKSQHAKFGNDEIASQLSRKRRKTLRSHVGPFSRTVCWHCKLQAFQCKPQAYDILDCVACSIIRGRRKRKCRLFKKEEKKLLLACAAHTAMACNMCGKINSTNDITAHGPGFICTVPSEAT